jgi:hypothetical protein
MAERQKIVEILRERGKQASVCGHTRYARLQRENPLFMFSDTPISVRAALR